MRFGFAPLYTRHVDVEAAVDRLVRIMRGRIYQNPDYAVRAKVT